MIPWEGTRLIKAVKNALPKLKPGEPVKLVARVSEGPEVRLKLTKQIRSDAAEIEPGDGAVRVQAGRELADGRDRAAAEGQPVGVDQNRVQEE